MKSISNDTRLVIPLAGIAIIVCSVAVMRITGGHGTAGINGINGASASTNGPAKIENQPVLFSKGMNKDPFYNPALKLVSEKKASKSGEARQKPHYDGVMGKPNLPLVVGGTLPTFDKNISSDAHGLPKEAIKPIEAVIKKSLADYKIAGIMLGSNPVAIIHTGDGKNVYVHVGDRLTGGAEIIVEKVTNIDSERVVLSHNGKFRTILASPVNVSVRSERKDEVKSE